MVDLTAIASAVQGFKAATDIAKGIKALDASTEVRERTSDLLDALLDARLKAIEASETQAALLDRIKHLEQQIAGFEHWNREKERYELKDIDRGAFAYVHKAGMENGEPAIWLCQTCFEKRHKSPLQFRHQTTTATGGRGMQSKWGCNTCKSEVSVYYARSPGETKGA